MNNLVVELDTVGGTENINAFREEMLQKTQKMFNEWLQREQDKLSFHSVKSALGVETE